MLLWYCPVSVRLSCHKLVFYRNGLTDLAGFHQWSFHIRIHWHLSDIYLAENTANHEKVIFSFLMLLVIAFICSTNACFRSLQLPPLLAVEASAMLHLSIWNKLTLELRNISSFASFKRNLKVKTYWYFPVPSLRPAPCLLSFLATAHTSDSALQVTVCAL